MVNLRRHLNQHPPGGLFVCLEHTVAVLNGGLAAACAAAVTFAALAIRDHLHPHGGQPVTPAPLWLWLGMLNAAVVSVLCMLAIAGVLLRCGCKKRMCMHTVEGCDL